MPIRVSRARLLEALLPVLVDNRVQLIEQPFRIGQDAELDGLRSPIRIAADESVQGLTDIARLVGRYDVINIKLDKCGGLTEGLAMAREARRLGLAVMVGNMIGSSLAMAPAFVLGPALRRGGPRWTGVSAEDCTPSVRYDEGMISAPAALWGHRPRAVRPPAANRPDAFLEIESHSIDFMPLTERYGTPRRLFTIWFSANMTILGVALGTLGIEAGLSLGWTLVALAVGNAVGTVFMAAHSAQGPQLGVPQMIQSRAQFGVRGAALPLLAVFVTYLLYCAANGVLMQGVITSILPIGPLGALVLFSCLTAVVAFVGYELIHRLGTALTVISSVLFAVAAYLSVGPACLPDSRPSLSPSRERTSPARPLC